MRHSVTNQCRKGGLLTGAWRILANGSAPPPPVLTNWFKVFKLIELLNMYGTVLWKIYYKHIKSFNIMEYFYASVRCLKIWVWNDVINDSNNGIYIALSILDTLFPGTEAVVTEFFFQGCSSLLPCSYLNLL